MDIKDLLGLNPEHPTGEAIINHNQELERQAAGLTQDEYQVYLRYKKRRKDDGKEVLSPTAWKTKVYKK